MRILYLLFAAISYAIFFATFLYLIGFVANLEGLPKTIDAPAGQAGLIAVLVNIALIALFGVQHSVMARKEFKQSWIRFVPPSSERSVYVLASSLVLIVLFAFWQPLASTIWQIEGAPATLIWAIFAIGWLTVLTSTFLINHFELFGLQQSWLAFRNREAASMEFRTPFFYRIVRHPIYAGFFLAFWATPVMTVGHLLFALGMSVYMLIGIGYEERDLVKMFGTTYEEYRRRVGMLIPGWGLRD